MWLLKRPIELLVAAVGLVAAFFGWTALQRREGRKQAEAKAAAAAEKSKQQTKERMDAVNTPDMPPAALEWLREYAKRK